MEERKIRKLLVLENLCKVFCFAHVVAAIMLSMMIDFAPDWPAVLFAILYCACIAFLLGNLSVDYKYRRLQLLRERRSW